MILTFVVLQYINFPINNKDLIFCFTVNIYLYYEEKIAQRTVCSRNSLYQGGISSKIAI